MIYLLIAILLILSLYLLIYKNIQHSPKNNNETAFEPQIPMDSERLLPTKNTLKTSQNKYNNVRTAYQAKENYIANLLHFYHVDPKKCELYLRAFKSEGILELWIKNQEDRQFQLAKSYAICKASGTIGPKRKEGDRQVPEGFYQIDRLNPKSKYFLSMHINYPNFSDRIFADKKNPGSLIFIHGNCVSIGCLPITDDKIMELYILCVEAMENGQKSIPITIFPTKLEEKTFTKLTKKYAQHANTVNLWKDLKAAYTAFNEYKTPQNIIFLDNGRVRIEHD